MINYKNMLKNFFKSEENTIKNISWKRIWIVVIVFVTIVSIFLVGTLVYAQNYKDSVLPGVYLGGVHIGGMDKVALSVYLQDMNNKLLDSGIHFKFTLDGEVHEFVVSPMVIKEDGVQDLIRFDIEKETESILNFRKNNNIFADAVSSILVRIAKPDINLQRVSINKDVIFEQVKNNLKDYVSEPQDASVKIISVDPLEYDITSSTAGFAFDYEQIAGHIVKDWSVLKSPELVINSSSREAEISEDDVATIVDRLTVVLEVGPLDVSFTDPYNKRNYSWTITDKDIRSWINVQKTKNGKLFFGLDSSSTLAFLDDEIKSTVNVDAEDAKFSVGANGKVTEFKGSRPGVTLDEEVTYSDIQDAFMARTFNDEGLVKNVSVTSKQLEPKVKTGEVNDLGISEVLGVGHSKFSGSPSNRIKNIRHAAVDKLHGLLIKPGENFSLIGALEPFTIEAGYLPELVIKGDEIKPEIAGGLCQVGTTMFRAAMNSGLKITERQNHSLVVSYYNDLSNGNPGTDATIYDPHPDFRFLNDTGNYILITTEMDSQTSDLYFYFWGTNDGREASYTPPVVSRWIPAGPTKIVETTKLAPGKQECQLQHNGAEASFTYTRIFADGKKEDVVFTSYYRALPKICLVGVDPTPEVPVDGVPIEGDMTSSPVSGDTVETGNNTSSTGNSANFN